MMLVRRRVECHRTVFQDPKVSRYTIRLGFNIFNPSHPSLPGYIENGDRRHYRDNPHKYLLYKPSISQLLVFLASGFKELPPGGALLLYMSADGCFSTTKHPEDYGYELGGLATSLKRDNADSGLSCRGKSASTFKEPHCLYPGDLYPFTRRPMFIIIDSDNSFVFQHIPRLDAR